MFYLVLAILGSLGSLSVCLGSSDFFGYQDCRVFSMFKNRVVVCLCSSREEFLLCCVHVSLDKLLTAFEFIVP